MLSDVTQMAIRAELARVPHKKTALLTALRLAQKEQGWLSSGTLAEVADIVDVPHSHAVELATFYAMLFTSPVAPVRVETCVQLPCALVGAQEMARKLAAALGVTLQGPVHKAHGRTSDNQIELHTTVECYGSCHRAPMCRVGDDYRENIRTDDDVNKLAAELRQRAR